VLYTNIKSIESTIDVNCFKDKVDKMEYYRKDIGENFDDMFLLVSIIYNVSIYFDVIDKTKVSKNYWTLGFSNYENFETSFNDVIDYLKTSDVDNTIIPKIKEKNHKVVTDGFTEYIKNNEKLKEIFDKYKKFVSDELTKIKSMDKPFMFHSVKPNFTTYGIVLEDGVNELMFAKKINNSYYYLLGETATAYPSGTSVTIAFKDTFYITQLLINRLLKANENEAILTSTDIEQVVKCENGKIKIKRDYFNDCDEQKFDTFDFFGGYSLDKDAENKQIRRLTEIINIIEEKKICSDEKNSIVATYNLYQLNNFFYYLKNIICKTYNSGNIKYPIDDIYTSKFRENYSPTQNIREYDHIRLKELLTISVKCSNILVVQNSAKANITSFFNLLIQYGITEDQIVNDYRSFQKKIKENGFVLSNRLIDLIKKEPDKINIRIICTTLMYFLHFYMEIYAILIKKETLKETKVIMFIKKALTDYTGLNENSIDLSECDINSCFVSELLGLTLSEISLPARYTGFPMSPIRIKRLNPEDYVLKFDELTPVLSADEIEYLKNIGWDGNMGSETTPYFVSGAYNSQIDRNSYFYKLSEKYKHFILTGPAGSVDMLFHVFGLDINFNVEIFVLLCIAYLSNCYHHTIYEILIVCRKYGLEYDSSMDEIEFVNNLLEKYIPKEETPSESGGKKTIRRSRNIHIKNRKMRISKKRK